MFTEAGHWIEGPLRNCGESAREENATPKLPQAINRSHRIPISNAILLTSDLLCRVSRPPRVSRDLLSLHEERVCTQYCGVTHGHAIEDERTDSKGARGANRGSVAFERAVLLRMALDLARIVEVGFVRYRGERRVRDVRPIVEDPPADPHAQQPPK